VIRYSHAHANGVRLQRCFSRRGLLPIDMNNYHILVCMLACLWSPMIAEGRLTEWTLQQLSTSDIHVLPVAFNVVFILSRLSFYGQLLEQLNVASLSCPTVFFALLLLMVTVYFVQINDDDDFLLFAVA